MPSSRRSRRRHQQKSLQRHQLRLEGLEKRSMLTASSTLEESSLLTVGDNALLQDEQTAYVSTSDTEAVADATLGASNLSAEVPGRFTVFESFGNLNFQWEPPPNSERLWYVELDYKNIFDSTWTNFGINEQTSFVVDSFSLGQGESYDFRLCPTYETGMGMCSQITWPGVISSPSIISVTTPAAGAYRTGDTLSFDIAFDEIVYVAGTPQISLDFGGNVVLAPYAGGSGTTTLTFEYNVNSDDLDENGISISSPILLNGGLIRGASGWDAILTFTPPDTTGVVVNSVNRAPLLNSAESLQLNLATADAGVPVGAVGALVSSLIDSGGALNNFSDADGDLPGIAIVGDSLQGGTLHYSIDNGATWSDVGVVSPTSARLLYADDSTRLYFEPAPGFVGSINDVITFRAWDRSNGYSNGQSEVNADIFTGQEIEDAEPYRFAMGIARSFNNQHVYVADRLGVSVVDITDRSNPVIVGNVQTPGVARKLKLSNDGRYGFVADSRSGLTIVDLQQPTNPVIVATTEMDSNPFSADAVRDVALSTDNNIAYAVGERGALHVIDISTRNAPEIKASLSLGTGAGYRSIALSGDYLFVAAGGNGFVVLNVVNPLNPIIALNGNSEHWVQSLAVSSDGQSLYVADNHLTTYDISEPLNPVQTDRLWLDNDVGAANVQDLALSSDGTTLLISGPGNSGLFTCDLSTPTKPELIHSLEVSGGVWGAVTSDDGSHVLCASGSSFFKAIALPLSGDPVVVGSIANPTLFAAPKRITSNGQYEFRAWNDGVEVYDLSRGRELVNTHRILPDGNHNWSSRDITLSADDQFAFVSFIGIGIVILDVSNPLSLLKIGEISTYLNSVNEINLSPDESRVIVGAERFGSMGTFLLDQKTAFSSATDTVSIAVRGDLPLLDASASPRMNATYENANLPVGPVGTLVSDLIDQDGPLYNYAPSRLRAEHLSYNFATDYGNDPQGNDLFNAISPAQKDRIREIFDLYGRFTGIEFIETSDDGATIAVGDTRVINADPTTGSVTGLIQGTFEDGELSDDALIIINSALDWGASEYLGEFFFTSMRQIGQLIGLWDSYENPFPSNSTLTAIAEPEPYFGFPAESYAGYGIEIEKIRYGIGVSYGRLYASHDNGNTWFDLWLDTRGVYDNGFNALFNPDDFVLPSHYRLQFVPDSDYYGEINDLFTFSAVEFFPMLSPSPTLPSPSGIVLDDAYVRVPDPSFVGGADLQYTRRTSTETDTVGITVTPVNRRPVLTPATTSQLNPVAEDSGDPVGAVGTLVSSLIDSGGALNNFSDADGDLPGVAIIGTSLQRGDLYYSIDNGTTWSDVGVVSPTSARLLYADDSTRLYFEPAPDFNGSISDVVTCKAWDRTGGFNNGDTGVDTSIITGQQVSDTLDHSYAYDVVLSANNNYAYVTDGLGLNVLDITNPSSPSLVGFVQTPGISTRIALSSNEQYAFVADGREGIAVIDLTSPASPVLLFHFGNDGTPVLDVKLSYDGNYGFATRGSGDLFVFNTSEPQMHSGGLSVLTSLFIGYNGLGIDLVGDYLYIAHGRQEDSVITVINITNPINPSIVSSGLYGMERELSFLPFTSAVLVSNDGQHLYTAHNYLSAFDLSEPSDPSLTNISWLPHSAGVPTAWNLTMSNDGQTLFVAGKRPGVCIYDLSVPSHPEFISSLELSSPVIDLATSVNGNHLFAATGSSFLDVLDISNHESPQKLGDFKKSDFFAEQRRVTRDGRYEFRAFAKSLEVLDPSTGTLLHKHEFPDVSNWASRHVVLSANDQLAFVALAGDSIAVVDVSDPLSSRTLGRVPVNNWFNDLNLSSDESQLILNDNSLKWSRTYEITESTAFSIDVANISVSVTPVNDRPILDPTASPVLFTQAAGADQPDGKVGMLVSKFIDDAGPLDNFSDVDGDLPGIAMIGTNLGGGILWFSTDEGDYWTQVSQVSGQAATLLAADNRTRIYLQLSIDAESRPDTVVTFKAWDRNGYPNGAQGVDTSTELYFSEQQDHITLDKPANILGDLSGVLTVGRVARGQFIWSDPDGSQFLSHDEWTRLTGSPEVIVPPEHGDATIFGRWSHDDQYWVTWFYDAGPYFSGTDSFVIRLKDEVGGHTDQIISVTGEPGPLANYPPTVDDIGSIGKTEGIPQVVVNGENSQRKLTGISYGNDLQPQDIRVSAVSDNGLIIADVQYNPLESEADLEFRLSQDLPANNRDYRSVFTITIEDAGLDNDFNTVGDNAKTEFLYHVWWIHMPLHFMQDGVDLTFSNAWGVLVNGIPVSMITSNHSPQILSATGIGDFRPVEATSDGADNYLLLHRGQTLNRLAANSEWQVTNLFDSLRNESSEILDVSGRAVSQTVIIASGIGAYEINGVNTPTLFVRRNQTVTFNLNAQGMPLYVQTTSTGYQASEMYSAFDANGQSSGQYEWVIPEDAPDELFYTMEFQPEGLGKIIVVD